MIRSSQEVFPEQHLTEEQVASLVSHGQELRLEGGELLFDETAAVDSFYVVLEGEIRISRLDGAEETPLVTHGPGDFTGGLVILTGKRSVHRARATVPSRVLAIDSDAFRRGAADFPEVWDTFVSGLARRMRVTQRAFRQHEKLAALGKLSAGLAHELNNPAAAARRAADELRGASTSAQLLALEHDERFSPAGRETLAAQLRGATTSPAGAELDPLALSDLEDEVAIWLEDCGVEDAWNLAPSLVEAGIGLERLEALAMELDDESLPGALGWLGAALEVVGLTEEVGHSAARISELVGAIKGYTYMDRDAGAEADVRQGLENTITMLKHKLKGARVERDYEEPLPRARASGGELNQVWTNLLDNAAEAVGGSGRVAVRAYATDGRVIVEISDDGPGIPPEIRGRVFEPFFTTKDVGAGTGLGLDIVQRIVAGNGGNVTFTSEPGVTRFTVALPAGDGKEQER